MDPQSAPPSWHGTTYETLSLPLPAHLRVYANRERARQLVNDAAWSALLLDLEADDL